MDFQIFSGLDSGLTPAFGGCPGGVLGVGPPFGDLRRRLRASGWPIIRTLFVFGSAGPDQVYF